MSQRYSVTLGLKFKHCACQKSNFLASSLAFKENTKGRISLLYPIFSVAILSYFYIYIYFYFIFYLIKVTKNTFTRQN